LTADRYLDVGHLQQAGEELFAHTCLIHASFCVFGYLQGHGFGTSGLAFNPTMPIDTCGEYTEIGKGYQEIRYKTSVSSASEWGPLSAEVGRQALALRLGVASVPTNPLEHKKNIRSCL
jgi:hypothetical protein